MSKRPPQRTRRRASAKGRTASAIRTRFQAIQEGLRAEGAPWPGAVALSGGGDSLALLHLLGEWARSSRLDLPVALIVDHGLRRDSAQEAKKVARWARALGMRAHILTHKGARPDGDIEAAAREARYRLLAEWLSEHRMRGLYVGHTRDDQAETLLIRMARGSGLDGLASMRPISPYPVGRSKNLSVVRPLLGFTREELRTHLETTGRDWLEDPMNRDPRFSRARIRESWPALEGLGLTRERLADAAAHLARAREALDAVTLAILERASRLKDGSALVERTAIVAAPRELGLRALAALLMAVSGQAYRPRFERLERLFDRLKAGTLGSGATLHGCRIAKAPRTRSVFGSETLIIQPEARRRAGEPTKASVD